MQAWLLLSTFLWSVPALACEATENARIFVASEVAQGSVVRFGYCLGDCRGARVEVLDAEGVTVPGELQQEGEHLSWKPAQALELGGRYTLEASGLNADRAGGTFAVVARVEPLDEGVQVGSLRVTAELVETGSECCFSLTRPPIACGPVAPESCLETHRKGTVRLAVSMTNLEQKSGQWAFYGSLQRGSIGASDELHAGNDFEFEWHFSEPQGRYCAWVDAISLVGDEQVRVFEECRDVDLTLPERMQETAERIASYRERCVAGGGRLQTTGEAAQRDRDDEEQEGPAPAEAEPRAEGCELRDGHADTLLTALLLLGLAARGSRRRSCRHDREDV